MKTAISVPDGTFERVEHRAHDLGMSRSEFFTRAANRYLAELDNTSITRQIDAALDVDPALDSSVVDAVAEGHRVLSDASGDW